MIVGQKLKNCQNPFTVVIKCRLSSLSKTSKVKKLLFTKRFLIAVFAVFYFNKFIIVHSFEDIFKVAK